MRSRLFSVMICLGFVLMAFPAGVQSQAPIGQGNIKVGALKIHPSIGVTGTYTDNVYQSYDGKAKESAFIATVSPGVQLVLPFSRHSISAGYRADVNRYSNFSENNYVSHTADAKLNLDFPGGLQVTVSDTFVASDVTRKWKDQPGLGGENDPYRAKPYNANDFLTKVRYQFADRWAAAVWYNFYKYDYDKEYDRSGSFDRHLGAGSLFYRFSPKTDALLEFQHSTVEYPKNSPYDNKNNTLYVGLGFDPSAKINGYFKVGWTQKKYDQRLAFADNKDDFNGFSTQIDLSYSLTPYDVINFRGIRLIEEDLDTNAPFMRTDISLGYTHVMAMNTKIRPNARLGYAKHDYEGRGTDVDGIRKLRDEKIYYASLGVDYAMQRWLTWSLGYTYRKQDSNFIRYDYDENRVFLNALVSF